MAEDWGERGRFRTIDHKALGKNIMILSKHENERMHKKR